MPERLNQAVERSAGWCIAGGAAIFIGALLPWISNTSSDGYAVVNSGGRAWSVIFGLILTGLGIAVHRWINPAAAPHGKAKRPAAAVLILSSLGILGYGIFTVAGLVGFQEQTDYGYQVAVTYSPNIGLALIMAGCVAAAVGSTRILAHAGARAMAVR